MIIYEKILREFQKQKVEYVLVGGVALNLLGSLRSTADLDILVAMTDDNLAKVVKILKKEGYYVKQPVDPMKIADKKMRQDWIKNKHMKAFNFYRDGELAEVDIIIDSPVSYKAAKKTAVYIEVCGINLAVISIDNLIKMKKSTTRQIDRLDIEQLRKIKKLRAKI